MSKVLVDRDLLERIASDDEGVASEVKIIRDVVNQRNGYY